MVCSITQITLTSLIVVSELELGLAEKVKIRNKKIRTLRLRQLILLQLHI